MIHNVKEEKHFIMKNKETGVINIAGGKQITINKLANIIIEKIGKDLKPVYNNSHLGGIKQSFADISKDKKFSYTPKYSLEHGLKETIDSVERTVTQKS